MGSIHYREMAPAEIGRIGEVDRTESVAGEFVVTRDGTGFGLRATFVAHETPEPVPPWGEAGTRRRIESWRPHLDRGGSLYGAFDRERLVGFVILGPRLPDASAEVVALFVDRAYRRRRIGDALTGWAEDKARRLGVRAVFAYSNPTESAARFYLKHDYEIVGLVSKEVVPGLPGDLVLAKRLT